MCYDAFEAVNDLPLGLPFGGTAPGVVKGGLMGTHAHDHHAVEGSVGLSMPTTVQPVPAGSAA